MSKRFGPIEMALSLFVALGVFLSTWAGRSTLVDLGIYNNPSILKSALISVIGIITLAVAAYLMTRGKEDSKPRLNTRY